MLAGDSHLAYVRQDVALLGDRVRNVAVGGAVVTDVLQQLTTTTFGPTSAFDDAVGPDDVVVVSIGTNDAAPYPGVAIEAYEEEIDRIIAEVHPGRWVYLAPPGVDALEEDPIGRSNSTISRYAEAAATRFGRLGAVVDSPTLLEPLGSTAFAPDGVHLSQAGYDVLLPAVARACD